MPTASADPAEAMLERVRRLEPRQILRLATLWAGVHDGSLDAGRQKRRAAARIALRLAVRGDGEESTALGRSDTSRAAAAVRHALDAASTDASRALRGPGSDAAFAVGDALDAIRHRSRLTRIAHDELLLPWRTLLVELGELEEPLT